MLGSVFSPYYARARRRGAADPLDHCALNVALYGRGARRWTLTERGRRAVHCGATGLAIGPSSLEWQDDALVIRIDELAVPLPRRVRGTLRLRPAALLSEEFPLDEAGCHRWQPLAPRARIEVDLEHPRRRWSGAAYLDGNYGDGPLEQAFRRWYWSRTVGDRTTTVLYDVERLAGGPLSLALRFDDQGSFTRFDAPPLSVLPRTGWRIARATRCDLPDTPRVLQTLEDTPFYARSLLRSQLLGSTARSIHETLSLERFRTAWVQALISFRMPRAPW